MLETFDGGATWTPRTEFTPEPFYDVYFIDANNGFAIGNSSTTSENYRTTNGGATWTQFELPAGSWREVKFVSATTGFVGANGAMSRTTDGGATWTLRSAYPDAPIVYGMDFASANVGFVCGYAAATDKTGVFKTSDGGATWSLSLEAPCNDVVWIDSITAIAVGGTSVYRTTNAGSSWSEVTNGVDTGLLEIVRQGPSLLLGVSAKGDIWRSTNAGLTWIQVFDGLGDLPVSWNVGFADAQTAWVVGQGGLMLRSSDAGQTWAQATNGFGTQWFQIEMANDNIGYIAGHNGYVMRTTDGGANWEVGKVEVTGQIFGRDESLRAVSVVDVDTVVVAGPGGTVFRTDDGGDTWQNIGYPNLPDPFWIEDVKFVSSTEGWVVGLDQDLGHFRTVYHTVDGGLTWTLALSQNAYFYTVDFADRLHGWIGTIGQLYFRTVDGGLNWTSHTFPPRFTSPSINEIRFLDASTGWAIGWDGLVAKSTDGGVTFTYQDLGRNDVHLFGLSIVSASEVWATGRTESFEPIAYRTLNGGTTWSVVSGPADENWLYGLWARPGGNVWGVGYDGIVYRRTSTTSTDIAPTSSIWLRGMVQSGNNASLAANDDDFFVARAGFVLSATEAPVQLRVDAVAPVGAVASLEFMAVSKVNTSGLSQRIELFNWSTGQYESVGVAVSTTAESTQTVVATGDLSRFVQPGTRAIRAKVSWFRTGLTLLFPWTVSVDQVRWRIVTE